MQVYEFGYVEIVDVHLLLDITHHHRIEEYCDDTTVIYPVLNLLLRSSSNISIVFSGRLVNFKTVSWEVL